MKRNKRLVKQRKIGTQYRRRAAYNFDVRGTSHWALAVPQAFAGVHQSEFDMTGAVPAGSCDGDPEDPRFGSQLRWRVDRGGRTEFVYGLNIWSGRHRGETPSAFGRRIAEYVRRSIPTSPDVYHVFTAERQVCTRGTKCPLTSYYLTHTDREVPSHRPDLCPAGVLNDGQPWRLVGRTVPDGRLII